MTAADAPAGITTLAPDATLAALDAGAVLRWWQTTAFLEVAGADAITLLDGLCTQAVGRIEPGDARLGLFLDAKAKIVAPAILHRVQADEDAEPRLLLETLPGLVEPLRAHLARYRLRAKAAIEPVELATIALVGAGAPVDAPPSLAVAGTWSRVEQQAHPTLAWIGDPGDVADAIAAVEGAGIAAPAAAAALEAARIDAGVAGLHDLLAGRMPAEVGGMEAAVALDAGCYLGQEPVARLHYRGHANRTLRRLGSGPGAGDEPIAPASTGEDADPLELVRVDDATGRPPGRLTTWARHPDGRVVALAVLRRSVARGDRLRLAAGSSPVLEAFDDAPA
jgi:folate-binding protein YgfZ